MRGFVRLVREKGAPAPVRLMAVLLVLAAVGGVFWAAVLGRGPDQTLLDVTLEQLESDVRRDPQNPEARLAVAIAYAARGLDGAAIEQFEQVLVLEENNQTALIGLGRLYLEQNDLDRALEKLLLVAELNKDNPYRRTLEQLEAVYYDLGTVYFRKKDYAEANGYLLQALEINSADADAWYMLGRARAGTGDFEGALQAYKEAVRYVPDYVDAYRGMGDVYKTQGKAAEQKYATGMIQLAARSYGDAVRDLRAATAGAPDLAEAHEGLGIALEAQGKVDEALESYRRALSVNPDLMLARLALERLGGR